MRSMGHQQCPYRLYVGILHVKLTRNFSFFFISYLCPGDTHVFFPFMLRRGYKLKTFNFKIWYVRLLVGATQNSIKL